MDKTRHKETRNRYHHDVFSPENSDDSDDNDTPTHKSPRVNSRHSCVQSSKAAAHTDVSRWRRNSIQDSTPDEEKINTNLKADNNNSGKDGIDDGEDDFKELALKN